MTMMLEASQIQMTEKMVVVDIELLDTASKLKTLMKTYTMIYFVTEKVVKVAKKSQSFKRLTKKIKTKKLNSPVILEDNPQTRVSI